jgi:hypothetical protein
MEMQFLRVITGSADGKIRIWNLLNGDCLRVMRGTSQLDPVLSISIYENRILVNTEYNVLLMEFEIVNYEYGSQRELDSENRVKSGDQKTTQRPYSAIRANRMALIDTVNARVFNDGRKSGLSHSFGPMSQKHFEEARQVHTPSNSRLGSAKRTTSIQHFKSESVPDSMQSKRPVSTPKNTVNEDILAVESIPLDVQRVNNDQSHRFKTAVGLSETKVLLKTQLKNMREGEYKELMDKKLYTTIAPTPTNADNVSQYAASASGYIECSNMKLQRPQSSPSKYDTKTMVRINESSLRSLLAKPDQTQPQLMSKTIENCEPQKQHPRPMSSFVSKVFETNEKDLRTNGMYPAHVNSKVPNPVKVVVSRPVSAAADMQTTICQSPFKGHELNSRSQGNMADRPKPSSDRPKSPTKKPATAVTEIYETNKLTAHDDLKLMTHLEIDSIVKRVDVMYDATQQEKFRIQQANYKRLWQLKSIGLYHGSLLARPKPLAPEIRE